MSRGWFGWTCLCGVLAAASGGHARAQEHDGPAPVNTSASLSAGADEELLPGQRGPMLREASQVAGHRLGSYAGVAPGSASAPAVPVARGQSKPLITWPGFQMRQDGSSRVFVQSTAALTPRPTAADKQFSLFLPGAKVAGNTNRLPLETRYFNTPVSRVNIDVKRDGVSLVLDLRAQISPVVSSERGPTGYYFVYIDLPKGEYVRETNPPSDPSAPAEPAAPAASEPAQKPAPGSAPGKVQPSGRVEGTTAPSKAGGKAAGKAGVKIGF